MSTKTPPSIGINHLTVVPLQLQNENNEEDEDDDEDAVAPSDD